MCLKHLYATGLEVDAYPEDSTNSKLNLAPSLSNIRKVTISANALEAQELFLPKQKRFVNGQSEWREVTKDVRDCDDQFRFAHAVPFLPADPSSITALSLSHTLVHKRDQFLNVTPEPSPRDDFDFVAYLGKFARLGSLDFTAVFANGIDRNEPRPLFFEFGFAYECQFRNTLTSLRVSVTAITRRPHPIDLSFLATASEFSNLRTLELAGDCASFLDGSPSTRSISRPSSRFRSISPHFSHALAVLGATATPVVRVSTAFRFVSASQRDLYHTERVSRRPTTTGHVAPAPEDLASRDEAAANAIARVRDLARWTVDYAATLGQGAGGVGPDLDLAEDLWTDMKRLDELRQWMAM
ncbi:hypothetical protein JCM11491_005048 [Sporobolomyces phaffii]